MMVFMPFRTQDYLKLPLMSDITIAQMNRAFMEIAKVIRHELEYVSVDDMLDIAHIAEPGNIGVSIVHNINNYGALVFMNS